MRVLGLDIADLLALSAYLVGVTVLGTWMGRTIRDTTDFFVGGRRFGKLLSTFFSFGAGTHPDQAVGVASKTYISGISGIWYQWLYLFVTPFYWIIPVINRRCRCLTLGDYFETRYSRSVAMLCVLVGILNLMISIGTMLKGCGAIISATATELNQDLAIAVVTVLFVIYGVAGGLPAAVVTDFIQGLLTIVFSFMLLPVTLYHIGGFRVLHERVAAVFDQYPAPGVENAEGMWSLVAPGEISLFYIIVITVNALVGIVTQPNAMAASHVSLTEREAQFGTVAGNLIKRICTVAWCLLGMCAFVLFPGMTEKTDIDRSFGLIASHYLPLVAPGLIGVFLASLLASIMDGCAVFMITCSALFTHNLYRPLTANRRPETHYVNVGRVAAAVAVAGGVFFAYRFESVLQGLELFWKVSAMMGIAFWVGLVWRKATAPAAWASTLLAFAALLFTSDIALAGHKLWSFNDRFAQHLPAFMLWRGELSLPWQMVIYLGVGLLAMTTVSLVTTPPPQARLDRFYAVLRTPTRPGEIIAAPFTLPAGVTPTPAAKLIDHPDFEIPVPSRRTVLGFLVVASITVAIVGALVLLVQIGA